ncbi:MAG: hypothetical protein JF616_13050 [Fibrobacteres bacterium]|nr:hypothetical protein [Fibrobacterota bacterium]
MPYILPLLCALAGQVAGKPLEPLLWKKFDYDTSGRIQGVDSLTYDATGKRLGLVRKGPDGRAEYSIQYQYDDAGKAMKTIKQSPEGELLEEASCGYSGTKLADWNRTEGGIIMDGLSLQIDKEGRRIAYMQVAATAYSFVLDSLGRAQRVSLLGGMKGGTLASAEFLFDSRHRHVATRFFGADSVPIGRDTLLREEDGRLRELRRFDAGGKRVNTVERTYGARGEALHKVSRDAQGRIEIRQELVYLSVDSLARLNRSSSAWKGSASAGPCELEWFRNLDLGIETSSLRGLSQLFRPPPIGSVRPDRLSFRDSLDRQQAFDQARVKAIRDSLGAKGRGDAAESLKRIGVYLDSLLRTKPESGGWWEAMDTAAGAYLAAGGQKAYAGLLERVRADSTSQMQDGILLRHILKYRLDRAYDAFCQVPASGAARAVASKPAAPPKDGNIPKILRADLAYRRTFLDRTPSDPSKPAFADTLWTYPELYRHIAAFLRTGDTASLDSIGSYGWSGWCGNGSEGLDEPRSMAYLIRDLESGNLAAALRGTTEPERAKRILECRGEDWESFFLGGIVDVEYRGQSNSIAMLARYGSANSLRKLLALHGRGFTGQGWVSPTDLGRFLPEPGDKFFPYGERSMACYRDSRAPVLPVDLRTEVFSRLKSQVDGNPYDIEAEFFVGLFARLKFPEREEYLKKLAAIPNRSSRKAALQALGPSAPDTATLPSLLPVQFVFTSLGKPLAESYFRFEVPCSQQKDSCYWGSSVDLHEGGYAMERRNYLSAWRKAKAVRFCNLYLFSEQFQKDALFSVTVPLREKPDGPVRVDIPLYRLALKLEFPRGFDSAQEKQMRIRVERSEQKPGSGSSFQIGLRREVVFPRLGDGTYRIAIDIPGLAPWESGPIQMHRNETRTVRLRSRRR